MAIQTIKTAEHLRRRCLIAAGVLLAFLVLLTLGLWRTSVIFMDIRLNKANEQSSRQAIERFIGLMNGRLDALRQVAHFYASVQGIGEAEFHDFCRLVMRDVPGIRAILITDTQGRPTWLAPAEALPLPLTYILTADPELDDAMRRSLDTRQTAITRVMDVRDLGASFLAAAPIMIGERHLGYAVGVFQYRDLLGYLLPPDMALRYRVSVWHAGRQIISALTMGFSVEPASPAQTRQEVLLGGKDLVVAVEPTVSTATSPANFVSMTILGLGLSLSLLLAWLAWRWQWQAALFQMQARESLSRLERTGLSLNETRTELDLILNSVDEGIIFYNEQLEPAQANAAFLLAFGLADDAPAMRSGQAHHEHMIQRMGSETKYWALFQALRRNPEQNYTDELETRPAAGKGGGRVLLRRATSAVRPDGSVRGMLVIYKDVTKIKMIDRVKDEFLSSVTHELRSPLASIKGFAETIRRDPAMDGQTRAEFVRIICEEAARLQDQIDELLDLRRMEAQGAPFNPAPYDIKGLVEEIVREARPLLLSRRITVRVRWDGIFGSTLQGDAAHLGRALRNLLANAVKYSPDGSEIAIGGHCGQYRVWVEVTDQGSGIDEKDLPHIFDKFYRGTRQGYQKGTGLGLAIVKNIVEMHGGHLGVRSVVGTGTTFRVDLPRACPARERKRPDETDPIPGETPLEVLDEVRGK